ncbi:hypothetical protein AHF37_03234 [Paragonimus kellicotti]|nr:hypothetical protein AHF37_03234 [Paragonimus kellicotti]
MTSVVWLTRSKCRLTNKRVEYKKTARHEKHGPVDANYLQFYRSGISHPSRYECDPAGLNHAVLTVGYGTENGIPYWIDGNQF